MVYLPHLAKQGSHPLSSILRFEMTVYIARKNIRMLVYVSLLFLPFKNRISWNGEDRETTKTDVDAASHATTRLK